MDILFFAQFPDSLAAKEGMSQRMLAIDKHVENKQRTYVFVSHRRYTTIEKQTLDNGTILYNCNSLVHFLFICKLIRSTGVIYFHSILNVLPVLPFLKFIPKNTKVILDLHGVVPEEQLMQGRYFKSRLYSYAEKIIFKRVNLAIAVTNRMASFYKSKYPSSNARFEVYPILPSTIVDNYIDFDSRLLDGQEETVNIVYSGNAQKWQNVDDMFASIQLNYNKSFTYTILTGDINSMQELLKKYNLSELSNVQLKSVDASELKDYYIKANYGFILRDDIIVNNVACPTKLTEYLFYGIIPILKSDEIGDFKELGFETISLSEFTKNLTSRKSKKNHDIVKSLIASYSDFSLLKEL